MLSIGKLGEGGARYYTEGLGEVDEYYRESGQATGVWVGAGAGLLGLDGEVDELALGRVLDGCDPSGGDPLGRTRPVGRVPGFDLCFRAPKSVSLLEALGERDTAAAVRAGHRAAVAQAVGYLDRSAVCVRRGHAGERVEPATGLVGAGFEHFTSRAGDPHLHTHVVVANLARGPDGRWSALDGRALYRQARTAGFVYEAALRFELTRTLGVEWGPVVNGIADLAGVSKETLRAFSRRRAQIEAELAARGAASPRAAQVAALATRPAKDLSVGLDGLRAGWVERARSLGVEPERWRALVGPGRSPADLPAGSAAEVLLGSAGLTEKASWFDRPAVVRAVAELAGDGQPADRIEAVADAVLADGRAVRLADGRDGPRWSTTDLVGIEHRLVEGAVDRRSAGAAVVEPRLVRAVVDRYETLSGEQTAMVESLCRSGDGVQVVVGVAGSGKTFALGAARDAWEASRYRVIGAALSARAAAELQDGARIPSTTVARLIGVLDRPGRGGLAAGTVLVVDEAAMVGTRDLARLADEAAEARAKLVLVGDDRQLPSIAAGGAFTALAERLGAVELVENRRQRAGWERHALAVLRDGRPEVALAAYHANQRRHHANTPENLAERLVGDWMAARAGATPAMMLATRRADVERLNELARTRLRAGGQLGQDIASVGDRGFAVGDEILCGRNDRRLGVLNGTRGIVEGPSPDGAGLVVRTVDGRRLELPGSYMAAGHVAHGYATTIHKAQGATTERTFILADDYLYQEAGYVALSRGRDRNDLYTTSPADDHEGHGPTRAGGHDTLRLGLGRSRAQQPAGIVPELPGRSIADLEHELRRLNDPTPGEDYAAGRRRARHLEAAIRDRRDALGVWALDHPRPEHLDLLGVPPRQPQRQVEWARAAGEISAYRERHGLVYQPDLLPEHAIARIDHYKIGHTLHQIEPALDRSRPIEHVRERDLGLGLGL